MKHAYLIIAHSSFGLLQELLSALDDVRNDIYVHIDKKANVNEKDFQVEHSKLMFLPIRLDGRWGDFSLVQIELLLFEAAHEKGCYEYYHLLSGVDFPIKSQNYIHEFCSRHSGREFLGFADASDDEIYWRAQHYFLFPRDFQSKNLLKKVFRALFARLQSLVGYTRIREEVKKGCQWCSISHAFVAYILQHKDYIYSKFNHTYCPDEMFLQTLCWNSPFKHRIYDVKDEFGSCKRYIKWKDGVNIQIMDNEDIGSLLDSEKWFARKFTERGAGLLGAIRDKIK